MDQEKSEIDEADISDRPFSGASLEDESECLQGWRLYFSLIGYELLDFIALQMLISHSLLTGLYLVNLEVTIVSTALIKITDDLDGFEKTSWVATGFLTTYTGI
jgi:hypothetical protein